nr:lysylphosphatidylglycerol synthase transmembrane domain-containing protein [Streptomyces sp. ICBB 8177]
MLVAAVGVAVSRHAELSAAAALLEHVRTPWLVTAVVAEAASMACLAALERGLLRAAGHLLPIGFVAAVTLGANAVAGALPGGAAFATVWTVRKLRDRRVEPLLGGAVLVVSGGLSFAALVFILVGGVLVAGSGGPGAQARPVVLTFLAAALVLVVLAGFTQRLPPIRRVLRHAWHEAVLRWSVARSTDEALGALREVVHSSPAKGGLWVRAYLLALGNWVCDCACLVCCMAAFGIHPPWRQLAVVYAVTQLAGALRLTPGGLGIVEGSLGTLLVWSGLPVAQAIAVTLLYRAISYWLLQPVGWSCWLRLSWGRGHRRSMTPPRAASTPPGPQRSQRSCCGLAFGPRAVQAFHRVGVMTGR